MKPDVEFARLDAMLDATLGALARRARADTDAEANLSFSTGGDPAEAEADVLWSLIERTREEQERREQPLSFDAMGAHEGQADGQADDGLLARAQRECSQLMGQVLGTLSHPIVVETGQGHARIHTRVGWTGDMDTHLAGGTTRAEIVAHAAAMEASLAASGRQLRLLTMLLVASSRIAAVIATPGAAIVALPIAYRCVRDLVEQWSDFHP
ncbi:MAG: hypothetical protein AAGF11_22105 [Myxococcota bacterium]